MQSWLIYNHLYSKNIGAKERKIYSLTNISWNMNTNNIYIWRGFFAIVTNTTLFLYKHINFVLCTHKKLIMIPQYL